MPTINLRYGKKSFPFDYDANFFDVLAPPNEARALSDVEIGAALDNPIDSKPLEDIVQPNETVLFVVPDATRRAAAGQIINLLVRRLISNGTLPYEITCIFATGIHRAVTSAEKQEILTPFIAQRIKTLDHQARDLFALTNLGESVGGIPIELNRALFEHDHVVLVGAVSFHYFAGFTGGRKLICPGLASSRTISETHKLAFDCENKTRRAEVGTARLEGNAVHEVFTEIAEKVNPSFSVNTIVNSEGAASRVFAGNWKTAHRAACDFYERENTIEITEKRGLVIVSCGGAPQDLNMIQAHKALEAASNACEPGGKIFFLAECSDGLGRADFLKWFEAENSAELAAKLCERYQVNGQTAWSLLKKAENFDIRILTDLGAAETAAMRLRKATNFTDFFWQIPKETTGYILPFGAKTSVRLNRT